MHLADHFTCHGVEINRDAAKAAYLASGASIVQALTELPPDLQFDAVVAVDVIEHVANPLSLIEQLLAKVTSNGVVILSTGDGNHPLWRLFGANWWYCYYPEHISFLSRAWLGHASREGKFRVVECASFKHRQLGILRRGVQGLAMMFYGSLPSAYLSMKRKLHEILRRTTQPGAPGNGVVEDHLLIVLAKADHQ